MDALGDDLLVLRLLDVFKQALRPIDGGAATIKVSKVGSTLVTKGGLRRTPKTTLVPSIGLHNSLTSLRLMNVIAVAKNRSPCRAPMQMPS
jgi:hypothetical protein